MIPQDFRDFFINSDASVQQQIVSSLLELSIETSVLVEDRDKKAFDCPHCSSNRIRANGKNK